MAITRQTNIQPWQKIVSAGKKGQPRISHPLHLEKISPMTSECFFQGNNELAGSRFAMMEIRPGFELWHYHGKFDHDVRIPIQDTPPMIAFSFCFSGRSVHDYLSHGHRFTVSPQSQHVIFYPFPDFINCMAGDMAFSRLSVLLSPEQFMACFDQDMDALSPTLQQLAEKGCSAPFLQTQHLNPLVETLLDHLRQCPFRGTTRKRFFEGCALQLVMLQLNAIESSCNATSAPVRMVGPGVQKRLQRVKEMLENRLDDPPSLSELAKEAAMSPPKLNQCFRHLYGTTVFEYLRQQRFDQAKDMLEQGLSVTEAALAVGYESLASFSLAFKKRFGDSPSRYFRQK
ncbi:MAG: hypothetical protein CSA22_10220 [Deltaproteobacteria bacterium]|nr:MAG: hypothetical protein CSA22_10220 [Deltaproteobacteria bacterium]